MVQYGAEHEQFW